MSDGNARPWEQIRLKKLGELSTSSVDKKVEPSERRVSLINYMDVYRNDFIEPSMSLMPVTASASEIDRFQIKKDDVLFTPSSETPDDIGHAALVLEGMPDTLHSYHTVRFRQFSPPRVQGRFAGHIFKQRGFREYVARNSTGSTRYTLSLAQFKRAVVSVPPAEEQAYIAQILDTLDTQIRGTEALIAKLERIKQGLLTDLLSRGIDQDGKLRPTPDQAPHLYEDSPLGQIPKDWECRKLFDLVKVRLGFAFSSASYVESGLPSFRVSDIGRGSLSKNQLIQLPKSFWDQHPKQQLFGKEIVIVMVGATTGKLGRVPPSICPALQNQNMWRLEPTKLVRQEYLYMLLPSAVDRHMRMAQGSARDFLSQKSFLETTVACAPLEEQERAEASLLGLVERIQCESKKLMKLKALKIGLMDDLLTGSVRVTPLLQSSERATA